MGLRHVNVEGVARLPSFSNAVIAGDTIYVSGTLGTRADGSLVPGGAGPETTQLLANIEQVLAGCGAGLADVAKVSVYLKDLASFGEMNAAWLAAFPDPERPARITVARADLLMGAAVEMDAVAWKPGAGS